MVDHVGGSLRGRGSTNAAASVEVEFSVDGADTSEEPMPRQRLYTPLIGLVLIAFVGLLVTGGQQDPGPTQLPDRSWSDSSSATGLPLGWPARGPLANDVASMTEAEGAWRREASTTRQWEAPGLDVKPIWAGEIDGRSHAILESSGRGDVGLVGLLSASPSQDGPPDWSLDQVVQVPSETPFLVLKTSGEMASWRGRIVPDPSLIEDGVQFSEAVAGRYERIVLRPDGISEAMRFSTDSAANVVGLREFGPASTLVSANLVASVSPLPEATPVRFVRPLWGGAGTPTPADYLDALAAVEATGRSGAWVYVAGSSTDDVRRVSLIAVWPFYEGWPDVVTVATGATTQHVSAPRPTAFDQKVVVGKVRVDEATDVVIAAAAPQADRVSILLDGEPVGESAVVASLVIPAQTKKRIVAEAYQADGTFLAREALASRKK